MFDPTVEVATAAKLADRIAATHAAVREAECEELVLAAAWADVHYLDGSADDYRPLVQRACAWGGDGCPQVAEHCAHELGALRGTGAVAARMLIADALDLRHRLPRLWALVRTGAVRAWQARAVAQTTHELSWEACAEVDQTLSGFLPMLAWPRFRRLLAAAVLEADPEARRAHEEAARTERGVWSYEGEHGLRTLVAKAASGDVRWFVTAVDRIAEILRLEGDLDLVDARRAKAIGVLAHLSAPSSCCPGTPVTSTPRGRRSPSATNPRTTWTSSRATGAWISGSRAPSRPRTCVRRAPGSCCTCT